MTLPKGAFKVRNVERPFSVENKQSNKQTSLVGYLFLKSLAQSTAYLPGNT